MNTLTQRASALRNMQCVLPEFKIIIMEDDILNSSDNYFAVFTCKKDIELFDRLSPMFAGFNIVWLFGCPAYELGAKH